MRAAAAALLIAGCTRVVAHPASSPHPVPAPVPVPVPVPDPSPLLRPYLDARGIRLLDVGGDPAPLLVARGDTFARLDRAGGALAPLPGGPGDARWFDDDDDALLRIADRDGDEQFQLARVATSDGATNALTDAARRNTSPIAAANGDLVWASPSPDGSGTDLLRGAHATLIQRAAGVWTPVEVSADGRTLLADRYDSATRSTLYAIALTGRAHGRARRLSRDGDATPTARWGAGGALYALSDRDLGGGRPRVRRLWAISKRGAWRCLTPHLDDEIDDVEVAPDGKALAFSSDVAATGASQLWRLEVKTGAARAIDVAAGGVIDRIAFAGARERLVVGWSSPGEPGAIDVVDLAAARIRPVRWASGDRDGLDPAVLVSPNHVVVASFDDTSIPVAIYPPAPGTSGRAPVVIALHEGPESRWRPSWQPEVQAWARLGFAVVEPDVRGSTGQGRDFLGLDDGVHRGDAIRDVAAVLDWIATQPDLDGARVAVVGTSYGGWLALASLVALGPRLRAGVDVVGMTDLVSFLAHTAAWRRDLRRAEYGDERDAATRAVLADLSPAQHVSEIRTPLLIVTGANDPRVPPADARALVDALRAGKAPVTSLELAGEGHGMTRPADLDAQRLATAQLLLAHL